MTLVSKFTYINDKNIADVPFDIGCKLVLVVIHLLKPLLRDNFILLDATELERVNS